MKDTLFFSLLCRWKLCCWYWAEEAGRSRPYPVLQTRQTGYYQTGESVHFNVMFLFEIYIHVNERCRRKEERSKQGQTNNKAKQHNTPKAITFPKKN